MSLKKSKGSSRKAAKTQSEEMLVASSVAYDSDLVR